MEPGPFPIPKKGMVPVPESYEPRLKLSSSQSDALDLASNILLTASAGSGKTTVLIKRFIKILEKNEFRPEEIVAITFTDKAASQIRKRIRGAIETRRNQIDAQNSLDSWERALRHLPRSPITTIHGFCHRLLRDYSLNQYLGFEFKLLKPSRQKLLAIEAVREALQDASRSGNESLNGLLEYLPQFDLEGFFRQVLYQKNHIGIGGDLDEDWLRDLYLQEMSTILLRAPIWSDLIRLLNSLPDSLLCHPNSFSVCCRRQLDLFENRSSLDSRNFVESFSITLDSQVVSTPEWRRHKSHSQIVACWVQLKHLIKKKTRITPCSEEASRHFKRAHHYVKALHLDIARRYEKKKRKAGGLDFDDLLVESARLIRKGRVVKLIQRRFRFFLIDEFQDTNELQWQVLRPLMGRSSNFFVVGDPQQSIYRFRGADVSVFRRVKKWITNAGRIVKMSENYRATRELLHFCNCVFRDLFFGDLDYEASHQKMIGARPDAPSGKIESCFYSRNPERHSESELEPKLVAASIQLLNQRGYRFSDISILLRVRTRLKSFEEALRLRGIPFQTLGGTGFYQRQEIRDLLNVLRFLTHTSNDIALVGVLRSPIFSLPDEDLLMLAQIPGEGYWQKMENLLNDDNGVPKHLRFAWEKLNSWLRRDPGMLASDLLLQILEDTGFLSILLVSHQGEQAEKNIKKFLELVINLQNEGAIYLRQIVRSLEDLIDSETNEPEADIQRTGQDAVRIFTIHGAKGLQFKAVVLPELGRKLTDIQKNRFLTESFGSGPGRMSYFGFNIRNPANQYKNLRHPTYEMVRQLSVQRQLAEEKRLLYVALTRAQDHLILIGERTVEESYARWLLDSNSKDLEKASGKLEKQIQQYLEEEKLLDFQGGMLSKKRVSLSSEKSCVEESEDCETNPLNTFQKRIWTPKELRKLELCARKFYLGDLLEYSEMSPFKPEIQDTSSGLFGEVVHDVIKKASNVEDADEIEMHLMRWQRTLKARLKDSKIDFENRVRQHLQIVSKNSIYHEMLQADIFYREKKFRLNLGQNELSGVFDCIYKRDTDEWVIVDFKTIELAGGCPSSIAFEHGYRLQLEAFLWAARRLFKGTLLTGFLLFTSSGESIEVKWSTHLNEKIKKVLGELPISISEEAFPLTTRSNLCLDCGFRKQDMCPGVNLN